MSSRHGSSLPGADQPTFSDTARDLGERIAEAKDGLLGETAGTAGDPDAEVLVAVHHDAVVRLDEKVGDAGGNVGEQPRRVPAQKGIEA